MFVYYSNFVKHSCNSLDLLTSRAQNFLDGKTRAGDILHFSVAKTSDRVEVTVYYRNWKWEVKDIETFNVWHLATMLIFLTILGHNSYGPSFKEASLHPIFTVLQLQQQQKQEFTQIIQKCSLCLLKVIFNLALGFECSKI